MKRLDQLLSTATAITLLAALCVDCPARAAEPQRTKINVPSSTDGTEQPCYLIRPPDFDPQGPPAPMLVALHTWSSGSDQRLKDFEAAAARRGWLYLFPNFRGRNDRPEACGSEFAQQDILDAVDYVTANWPVDKQRIYLAGVSGGGHMTMLMAGRHPERFAAASAWVGISDLAAWHEFCAGDQYGAMIRACCGGRPGDSPEVDAEYRARSPLTHLAGAATLPLDLAAGVHDGHTGSVPIRHTLDAYNAVVQAAAAANKIEPDLVTEAEIEQLSRPDGRLEQPRPGEMADDPSYGRAIHLRRQFGDARVTIFEGGHESLGEAAAEWLSGHRRDD